MKNSNLKSNVIKKIQFDSKAVKVKEPVLPDDSTFPIYEKRYKEWCRLNEIMKTYWDEKSKG